MNELDGQIAAPADLRGLDASVDDAYEVLSEPRRRFVLAFLDEHATPIALADVADELAIWEHDAPITEIAEDEVENVYISLYHVHVPKLEALGFVRYCQDRDTLVLTEAGAELHRTAPLLGVR